MRSLRNLLANAPAMREALEAGADPNERDAAGDTPMHAAAWGADLDAVRTLLAHGADIDARNHRGVPVLHEAVRRQNTGLATLLATAGANVSDHAGDDQSTPLHWAAKDGDLELAALLVERGASVEAVDALGRTPLQWVLPRAEYAYANPRLAPMIQFLLSTGAEHSLENAIAKGTRDHVRRWLRRGTAPNAKVGDGRSALAVAAERGSADVVRLLLDAGASPDGEPFDTLSPLARAVAGGRSDVAEILLQAGADPEWEGGEGRLPLDGAVERLRTSANWQPDACGALLIAHGARPTPHWAVICDDPGVLHEALARGWDANRTSTTRGDTALVLAASADRPRMVAALLESGADPTIAGEYGSTPLHAAAEPCASRTAVVKLLLEAGADPNARNREGRSPLHVALRMVHTYCVSVELVEMLVAAGADPALRDAAGATPIEVDRPDFLEVDVRDDAAEVVRRRDAAVAAVAEILARANPRPSPARPGAEADTNPNIAARLSERAARHPERLAIVEGAGRRARRVSFGELDRRVRALARGLADRGIGPGDAVLLFVPMSADLYVALLACLHCGATAVFVDAW
ncbi:MAG: ankyrin repeat domain-containing protein, partial [Gemmatimonadetes bacterium]|nr:ankyrin repeat domain-containing protein [Gemmatimonadota bacterium]